MKTSRLLLLAALLVLATFPAAAQITDTYIIPASANARGAFGTHWKTRLSIFNPHLNHALRVSITLLRTGGVSGGDDDEWTIDIPANSLAYSDNILEDLFEVESGTGSLLLATFAEDNPGVPDTITDRAFLVTSNTFNDHPSGTYGQTIPGVWTGLLNYGTDQISSVAHDIRNTGVWRTNVGAVNLGRCNVEVVLAVYNADGETVAEGLRLHVPPLGHIQDRLPTAIANGSVEFFVIDPCVESDEDYAVVFPYTSTIDQRSGDPTYQSPVLLAPPNILYAKGQQSDPTRIGKKLDSAVARNVRANVQRRGVANLVREAKGWRIVQ